jgi:hypothetical protein
MKELILDAGTNWHGIKSEGMHGERIAPITNIGATQRVVPTMKTWFEFLSSQE